MNIKITADSTCDLSADILKEYNIAITPLTVIKAGTGYIDGVTITPAEIFAHVAAGGDLCSTSAVSVGEYQEHFTKYAGEYDGVVHICISSDFSSAAALGANLLNLKPCIEVKDGKMGVAKKYRGKYAKCLANYVKDRLDGRDDLDDGILFITHTGVSDECHEAVMEAVSTYGHFHKVYETLAGCTVSCHCGPGTLGVLFVRKK